VYLAYDTSLRRSAALKLLPPKFTENEDRLRRFEREACAASALSHPNIITIYEIGHEGDAHFMAMEYVQGETLRQRIKLERMSVTDALNVAVQIAEALVSAHAAGIVHRDIKPENIMIRPDGYVKVLDFGLVKLSERDAASVDTQAPTMPFVDTDPGTVMGTAQYMSPEQTRGLTVDARTDIWSLGVVLYEMLTGQTPFSGSTPSDVIVSILDREPQPLSTEAAEVPAELERIVRKALRKNRDERYQTVKDMALDLKSLRRDLEVSSEIERSAAPTLSGRVAAFRSGAQKSVATNERSAQLNSKVAEARQTEAGARAGADRSLKIRIGILLALLLFAAAGFTFVAYKYFTTSRTQSFERFRRISMTRLTSNGNARTAAISPDGKYVVYAMEEAGKQSLWIRQVAIASNVRLLPIADVKYLAVAFSADGNFIYYAAAEKDKVPAAYRMPVLGGSPIQVIEELKAPIGVSPDDKKLAYVIYNNDETEATLAIRNIDGTGEQKLITRKSPAFFGWLVWSPDQQSIICNTLIPDPNALSISISEIRIAERTERQLGSRRWVSMGQIAWLMDGSALIFTAKDQESPTSQIWGISYPSGEARKITDDSNNYEGVSLTTDASTLVTVQIQRLSNVWLAQRGDTKRITQITPGGGNYYDLSWTPGGKIVYSSDASGSADVWEMSADGTGQRQLTAGAGRNYSPVASPDGRYILFHSNRSGTWQIWRMNADGSNPKQMTNNADNNWPQVTPDSQWVLYVHQDTNGTTLWKIPIEGGTPARLTDKWSERLSISPDGKLIACWQTTDSIPNRHLQIAVLSSADSSVIKLFDMPTTVRGGSDGAVRWTPDGQTLTYIEDKGNGSTLMGQPLKGGDAVPLTESPDGQIYAFDWSPDGRLIISRGIMTTDAVLITSQ
ncbi:MAG: protein kinase, partial [Pyrinomonadaceae bacterium]